MDVRYDEINPSGDLSGAKSAPFTLDWALTPPFWESSKVSLLLFSRAATLRCRIYIYIHYYMENIGLKLIFSH